MYPTFLNYTLQMAGYASQYHQFSNARVAAGVEKTYSQVEAFARHIHTSLNPTEVAYHVANEGRKLIECDRLCVGVRHDRKRVTVEAVSGADVVERASTHVRRLRILMEAVLQWGEPLTFRGQKDPGLPPAVAHALDEYLHESQPKLLIVQPCRDERETDKARPARSVLVMECFNPPEQTEPIVQRLDVVIKHAAPALYNAAELKKVPLKFLWWPVAKVQEGLGGKRRFIAVSVAVLLAGLVGAMVLIPAPLRMEAKGQMQPVEIAKIYPPREGGVRDLRVKPGDKIDPNYEVANLYSREFEEEAGRAVRDLAEANAQVAAAIELLSKPNQREEDKLRALTDKKTAESRVEKALSDLRSMDLQYNNGKPNKPGHFRAVAPPFDPKLARVYGASRWTVLNDDRRESLLGRTLRPSEELLRIGNLEGAWQVKLDIPQRNVGQILKAFTEWFKVTGQVVRDLRAAKVPDAVLTKLNPILDDELTREELVKALAQHLTAEEVQQYQYAILERAPFTARNAFETDPLQGNRKFLRVDVLLASQSDTRYEGRLYRDEMSAEAVANKNEHDENEPIITAYVKLNVPGTPEEKMIPREHFVTGLEVRTRIRCGDHALGYTLFHGVWEWFYEKVIFFF
jgi:hypothetical protein